MRIKRTCPCCGQEFRGERVVVSLEFNTLICGERAIEVTPTQAEILYSLAKRYPAMTSQDALIKEVWGATGALSNTMRTLIYTTRLTIEKIGYTIKPCTRRGYRLAKA